MNWFHYSYLFFYIYTGSDLCMCMYMYLLTYFPAFFFLHVLFMCQFPPLFYIYDYNCIYIYTSIHIDFNVVHLF